MQTLLQGGQQLIAKYAEIQPLCLCWRFASNALLGPRPCEILRPKSREPNEARVDKDFEWSPDRRHHRRIGRDLRRQAARAAAQLEHSNPPDRLARSAHDSRERNQFEAC